MSRDIHCIAPSGLHRDIHATESALRATKIHLCIFGSPMCVLDLPWRLPALRSTFVNQSANYLDFLRCPDIFGPMPFGRHGYDTVPESTKMVHGHTMISVVSQWSPSSMYYIALRKQQRYKGLAGNSQAEGPDRLVSKCKVR